MAPRERRGPSPDRDSDNEGYRGGGERRDRRDRGDRGGGDRGDRGGDRGGDRDRDFDAELSEVERDSLAALKGILLKVAQLLKPLGLTPEESTRLVERLYERVIEADVRLAGEPDDVRRNQMLELVQQAAVRREDGELVIDYPGKEA